MEACRRKRAVPAPMDPGQDTSIVQARRWPPQGPPHPHHKKQAAAFLEHCRLIVIGLHRDSLKFQQTPS